MLTGYHHRGHPLGLAVFVFHGHLRLAVRAQAGDRAGLSCDRQLPGDSVSQHHWQGQKLQSLPAGIAIDHALVSSTHFRTAVHSPGNVRTLIVGDDLHLVVAAVACFSHGFADDVGNVRQLFYGDFSRHKNFARSGQHLAGHPGVGIVLQTGIQNAVRDGIAELVRMALRDRLGGQDVFIVLCHGSPFSAPGE